MAEEWDDDDFGTFESADAESSNVSDSPLVATQNNPPAWILEAQSPKILETTHSQTPEEKYSELSPEKLSDTSIFQETISNSAIQDTLLVEKNENDVALGSVSSNDDPVKSEYSILQSGDHRSGAVFNVPETKFAPFSTLTSGTSDDKLSDKVTNSKPKKDNFKSPATESKIVLELQSKLDSAIIIKEQTEKSMSDLRQEITELTSTMKKENNASEKARKEEILQINKAHDIEIKALKDESQKVITLMTRQFSEMSRQALNKQLLESDNNLEKIVQKCLTILEQQSSVTQKKVNDENAMQENKIKVLIENCEKKLKSFVDAKCLEITKKCSQITEDAKLSIKEQIDELLKTQMEITTETNKEALHELTKTYEKQLEVAFEEERLKNCQSIQESVENARQSILDSVISEEKKNKLQREQNFLALQMLLSASQEQLKQLSNQNKTE